MPGLAAFSVNMPEKAARLRRPHSGRGTPATRSTAPTAAPGPCVPRRLADLTASTSGAGELSGLPSSRGQPSPALTSAGHGRGRPTPTARPATAVGGTDREHPRARRRRTRGAGPRPHRANLAAPINLFHFPVVLPACNVPRSSPLLPQMTLVLSAPGSNSSQRAGIAERFRA